MKHYILENDMDIETYSNRDEAIKNAKYLWSRMTEKEKKDAEYFQVYEIECDDIDAVEDDLMDLMTEMIINFKRIDIKYILVMYDMTIKELSDRFNIPYRTVQNWAADGNNYRECPAYVVGMITEILSNTK